MDKSIEAAVDAGLDVWHCGKSIDDGMRAAIAAYRDAEIADLRAQLAAKDAEVGRLTHDIERHIAIASQEADARIKAEAEVGRLREAARDALSGWIYIRGTHGNLYGVGWDRVQDKLEAALQGEG